MIRLARPSSAPLPRTTFFVLILLLIVTGLVRPWLIAQAPEPAKGVKYAQVSPVEMKEWLTYLASDELQGRQIFTEGYGLAAAYIADHLKEWKVKPLGTSGTYFQPVKLNGYKSTRNSSITLTTNGESKTFKHGDHVTFPANAGGKQTVSFSGVEFVGYGTAADYEGRDVKGKLVIWLPRPFAGPSGRGGQTPGTTAPGTTPAPVTAQPPASAAPGTPAAVGTTIAQPAAAGRGGSGTATALSTLGAKAAITLVAAPAAPSAAEDALTKAQQALEQAQQAVAQARQQVQGRGAARGAAPVPAGRGRGAASPPDFSTVLRIDNPIAPQMSGDETFFDALFAGAGAKFADLRARAEKGEPLAPMTLAVSGTIAIDNTYELVNEQLSKNVVGMIEGSDPQLKDTYVLFGAHLDHVGYRSAGGARPEAGNCRRTQASAAQGGRGQGRGTTPPPLPPLAQQDIIFNGADDDGSGSTAMLAIAKAFATGPKPKRSVVFVWHSGEEAGLYGSRYNADFPVVPLDKVQAQLNMDMVGRDDCDNANGDYTNTVFVVGADRISTDLHNLIVEANAASKQPLKLDYELNDPNDPESVYTRSDHYSYASKGIPIAFFTTGLHKDYHQVSDEVSKILFPKMARIAQLVYETGFSIANTDRVLVRDNKGPRSGKSFEGEIAR